MREVTAGTVGTRFFAVLGSRRVDGHVGRADALEEGERLRAVLVVEPRAVAELDQHLVGAELVARPLEVLERRLLEDDVRRQLEEDAAELPRAAQRLERVEEAAEHLAAKLARRPVDAAALVDRHLGAQVLGQHLDLHRMPRHQAERLHVHREPGRRALGPALHHRLARQAVVRRVDLDRVEELRVPREPLLRGQLRRVEVLRERRRRPTSTCRSGPAVATELIRTASSFATGLVDRPRESVALDAAAGRDRRDGVLAARGREVPLGHGAVALQIDGFLPAQLPDG